MADEATKLDDLKAAAYVTVHTAFVDGIVEYNVGDVVGGIYKNAIVSKFADNFDVYTMPKPPADNAKLVNGELVAPTPEAK